MVNPGGRQETPVLVMATGLSVSSCRGLAAPEAGPRTGMFCTRCVTDIQSWKPACRIGVAHDYPIRLLRYCPCQNASFRNQTGTPGPGKALCRFTQTLISHSVYSDTRIPEHVRNIRLSLLDLPLDLSAPARAGLACIPSSSDYDQAGCDCPATGVGHGRRAAIACRRMATKNSFKINKITIAMH